MRTITTGIAILTVSLGAVDATAQLRFTEVQESAGILFDYHRAAVAAFGAGGSWLDYDQDGWPDLFLTQMSGENRLFRNQGDGTFVAVPDAAGLADPAGIAYGAVAGDYDNDGDPDLFVTNNGQNRLYRNQLQETGTAVFVEVTNEAGLGRDGLSFSTSASWGDFDADGLLDLYVGNYISEFRPEGLEELSTPNTLWWNRGDGTFESVGPRYGVDRGAANVRDGIFTQPGATLATTWSDADGDGDLDILVINDFGSSVHPEQFLRNDGADGDGGWLFTDVSMESEFDVRILGMGIGVGDVDNDGDLDYYASNGGPNVLLHNRLNEVGRFDEIAEPAGVEAFDPVQYGPVMGPISWGCDFADFDHDGWVDLLVVNGFLDIASQSTSPLQPSFIYRNNGDLTFDELHVSAGLAEEELAGKASGFADYDRDGDVDFFIGSLFRWNPDTDAPEAAWYRLYRNDTPKRGRHWFAADLTGTLGNRDAIGAWVWVTADGQTQLREVGTGRSFLSSSELTPYFGVGLAERIDEVRVRFLSGVEFVDRYLEVDRRWSAVEPTVTLDVRADGAQFPRGSTVELDYDLTNHLDTDQLGSLRIDLVDPAGGPGRTVARLDALLLTGGETIEGMLSLVVGPSLPLGPQAFAVRWSVGDEVSQQRFVDAVVVDPNETGE